MTAAAFGREREQSNAGFSIQDGLRGGISLGDDFGDLVGIGMFAGGHIGEKIDLTIRIGERWGFVGMRAFNHDGEAGKS